MPKKREESRRRVKDGKDERQNLRPRDDEKEEKT